MTSIEETGKNIEEATTKALEKLGVTEDEVDVEILEEGARGFLGIGQALAKVRVTPKEAPPAEHRQRPRRPPRQRAKPAPPPPAVERPPVEEAPAPPVRVEPPAPAPPPRVEQPVAHTPTREEIPPPTGEVLAEASEFAKDLLQRILDALGNGGTAILKSASGDQIVLDIEGGDAPRNIGRHGQTINALQYLVGIAANRKFHARMRTVVDCEDYRARREDALKKQAAALAKQVKEAGQEAVLDALDANERRIIHSALADDPDVYTYSEGEEPDRHLVISPKK